MTKTSIPSSTPQAVAFTEATTELIASLWSRWQDEKEYEDIKDYLAPFKKHAEQHGVELRSMTKQPFGLKFAVKVTPTVEDPKTERVFHFTCNARVIEWKRIA